MNALRLLVAPLILALAPSCARAGQADRQTLFTDANAQYENSRYAEAISGYRNLISLSPRAAAAHYNLGNAYFRFAQPGSLGLAIASYERAFALRPRDSDIRQNLDFALRRAGESLVPPGVPSAFFVLYHLFSMQELAAFQWLGYWCALLLGTVFLLRRDLRDRLKPWLAAAAAFWLASLGWWAARALTSVDSPGVILHQMAEVRSGPGENFSVSFKAPEGRLVTVLGSKGEWVEIGVLKEGLKGWLPAEAVEKI
jgi:tetratricopeptide (TPR) repeat protein